MENLYVEYIKYASDMSLIENDQRAGAEVQRRMIGKNGYVL
jgi:hypothetical protein